MHGNVVSSWGRAFLADSFCLIGFEIALRLVGEADFGRVGLEQQLFWHCRVEGISVIQLHIRSLSLGSSGLANRLRMVSWHALSGRWIGNDIRLAGMVMLLADRRQAPAAAPTSFSTSK
jgi:hypothetical protein